ncbi:hypothetical protein [Metabacillus schmidteae]|uniref:hypothetical protein n=1 Tax=Metabacillus schmidteae TaxID=2730405 RepID=UPI00158EDE00|nr:hypothetical protein [Metabacillus schmidteae]
MKTQFLFLKNAIHYLLIFCVLFVISVCVHLFFNIKISTVYSIIMALVSFLFFCFCLYLLLNPKRNITLLSRKSGILSFILLTICTSFLSIYFLSINHMIATELGENLTIEEKYQLYIIPFQKKTVTIADYKEMKKNKLTTTYGHVEVYYESQEVGLLPIIEESIDKADELTTVMFGEVKDNQIDLILHSSTEELYEKTSLIETMGYFDDPNNIIGIAITDLSNILLAEMPESFYFQSTLLHEYTHYRLQAFIKQQGLYVYRIPLWFHEGIAEYIGMHNVAHRYYPFREVEFKKLDSHQDWEKYRLEDYDVYLQSYYGIKYLVDQFGESMIKTIIIETAKENDFDKGFSNATGMTIEELQEVYVKDAKQTYTK